MKVISVSAESQYNVLVDCNWRHELLRIVNGKTRIAIVHSSAMAAQVRLAEEIDGEVFYFSVPDGEDAKSFSTISKLWDLTSPSDSNSC